MRVLISLYLKQIATLIKSKSSCSIVSYFHRIVYRPSFNSNQKFSYRTGSVHSSMCILKFFSIPSNISSTTIPVLLQISNICNWIPAHLRYFPDASILQIITMGEHVRLSSKEKLIPKTLTLPGALIRPGRSINSQG